MRWAYRLLRVRPRGVASWAIAVLFFAASFALSVLFDPFLDGTKFVTFYPAIAVATMVCGWREGLLVLILSAVTAWYFFLEPTYSFVIKDATTIGQLTGFLLVGGFILLLVGALRLTNRRLEVAKAAQETLFSELTHRVANNLQFVIALLRHAQRNLRDPALAAQTLNDAEERIMALSNLHRRLSDGTAFSYGLNTLLRELLANAFGDLPVTYQVDVTGAPDLSIDQMTALALLVNEAALNASKHVFSKGLGTRFDVSLSKDTRGHYHLAVKDDGPGFPAEEIDAETRSMGMIIMESFAKQLGGRLELGRSGGALLNVEFTNP
jgi:two-component sensor histidine kinase